MRPALVQKVHWRLLVLDEGHVLKNQETEISQTIRRMHFVTALLLTGTSHADSTQTCRAAQAARRLRRLARDADPSSDATDYTLSSTARAFVPYYAQRICTASRMHGAQGILKGIRRARRDLLRPAPAAPA